MFDYAPCPLDGENCGCDCPQRARCTATAEEIRNARALLFRLLFGFLFLVGGGVAIWFYTK